MQFNKGMNRIDICFYYNKRRWRLVQQVILVRFDFESEFERLLAKQLKKSLSC